jgi:hypothetical protein
MERDGFSSSSRRVFAGAVDGTWRLRPSRAGQAGERPERALGEFDGLLFQVPDVVGRELP